MLGMDRKSVVRVSLGDEKVKEKGIDIVESKRSKTKRNVFFREKEIEREEKVFAFVCKSFERVVFYVYPVNSSLYSRVFHFCFRQWTTSRRAER